MFVVGIAYEKNIIIYNNHTFRKQTIWSILIQIYIHHFNKHTHINA